MKTINVNFIFILTIVLSGSFLLSCGEKAAIVIASKNFTENIILAEIISTIIQEKTDITVEVKQNFGSTFVVHQAMETGEIDIYPDYTGTLYQAKLKLTESVSPEKSLAIVQHEMLNQFNWIVFPSFGFNNTYAMGLLKTRADELGLRTISDLRWHPYLIAGFDSEFIARKDGGKKMLEAYNIALENKIVSLEIGLRYQAINEKEVDFTDVFSTDSKLKRFNMVILEDDKNFFPAYYAVPVVRKEVLDKYPEIIAALSFLENILDEETMINLNFKVEEEKMKAKEVAREYLEIRSLI